jgi:hypothetical protein
MLCIFQVAKGVLLHGDDNCMMMAVHALLKSKLNEEAIMLAKMPIV